MKILKIFIIFSLLVLSYSAYSESLKDDPKYCGFVPRDSSGNIKRSTAELRKFQRIHPCPSTGLTTGSCDGWQIDHILPLSIGGCDSIINMQWLPNKIKNCSSPECKDRWERKIHDVPIETPGFKPLCCSNEIITFGE